MSYANPTGAQIVKKALRRFPTLPTLTLARKLYGEHREVWSNLDACRSHIRLFRGARGEDKRKSFKDKEHYRDPQKPYNPYRLPKSFEQVWEPFIIEGPQRVAVIGDVHIPYHNIGAVTAFLDWLKPKRPTLIIINGDLIDFHRLSRFCPDPKSRSLKDEIKATVQFLRVLRRTFPKARIIWKKGNHEERLDPYLVLKAPELLDLDEFKFENLFSLEKLKVEMVDEKRVIKLGKLAIIHGHEYPTPVLGPVNAARGLFLRAKANALVNHHHQSSEHTEPTINGDMITCWSLGCLCELNPKYARLNKWSHGAAYVEVQADGTFEVENKRILNGRVL
jgi:predicted phosphodiesterase